MLDPKVYIPKALAFQRVAKSAISAASQVDHGTELNDAHAFALLEFFEFLAPDQIAPLMGPGLAAEFSAIIEGEFAWDSLDDRTPLQNLLCTHASVFVGLYCCDQNEEPKCHRAWLRFQERTNPGSPSDRQASLMANFEVAMGLGRGSQASKRKLQLLKHQVATRTAELLLAAGFRPEATLSQIRPDEVPKPAEILAMQAFVLLKKSPEDLARVCAWGDGSFEAAFLAWASRDSFIGDALIAWRWLKPVSYDGFPGDWEQSSHHRGLLYVAWKQGRAGPANLALREEPWIETNAQQPFPSLLAKEVKPRFSPVPLMLIGASGVGKTTFLRALSRRLQSARGRLREGTYLETTDLQEIADASHTMSEAATSTTTAQTVTHTFHVRDERDPEIARWMRLQFTDYSGEQITRRTIPPELLRKLRRARGLVFFVDERTFTAPLSNGGIRSLTDDDHKDPADLAARYTYLLQRYFDVNKDALHLPVALVINKADLLLGPANLLSLNPPFLIPEETKMELVHGGLQVQGEEQEPFARLRRCIRYNLTISRNSQNQRFVFALIEHFKGFIAAAMCHTYRFQIFLTSSLMPKSETRLAFPYGVWDVAQWVFNQLEPAYRLQASESIERAANELEEMKILLATAILRDHDAEKEYLKAIEQRRQITARVRLSILDQFLQHRIEHASQQMQEALRDALSIAALPTPLGVNDPPPFPVHRRLAEDALNRLTYQITYLREWQKRLSGGSEVIPASDESSKKVVMSLRNTLKSERRAS
jgi:energy-coupling factor transporter ATP-binding protein EcfA2